MINKEELKKMYYYIGIKFYKHKLVRIFRTRTNYKYVFYYDNNGELSLMGARDSIILAKQLTPSDNVLRVNRAQLDKNMFDVDFSNIDFESIFKEINAGKYYIKENSIEARVIPNQDPSSDKIVFEIIDKSDKSSFPCKIEFINQATDPQRGKLTEEDIYGILEDIEQYKEKTKDKDASKVLKRLNGYKVILQDKDAFQQQHNEPEETNGLHNKQAHEIYINQDKSLGESQSNSFKSTIKHEVNHAMSSTYNKYEKGEKGSVGIFYNGIGVAFNESITECLTGKFNGKYKAYPHLMEKFEILFDKAPSQKIIESYYGNNFKQFINSLSEEFNISKETALSLTFSFDNFYNVLYSTEKNIDSKEFSLELQEAQKNLDTMIMVAKLNQMTKKGENVSQEQIDELLLKVKIGHKEKGIINELLNANNKDNSEKEIKDKIGVITSVLSHLFESNVSYDELNTRKDIGLGKNKDDQYKEFEKMLFKNSNAKMNDDYATFFALTAEPEKLISLIDKIEKCFEPRSIVAVQQSILSADVATMDVDFEKKLLSLHDTNKEFYKGLIKTSLVNGSETYLSADMQLIVMPSLYQKLNKEEKLSILVDLCQMPGDKKTNIYAFSDMVNVDEVLCKDKETALDLMNKLTSNLNKENFEEIIHITGIITAGHVTQEEVINTVLKRELGEEKYNSATKNLSEDLFTRYEQLVKIGKEHMNDKDNSVTIESDKNGFNEIEK